MKNLAEHNETGLIGDFIVDHGVGDGSGRRVFFIGLVAVIPAVAVPVDNPASIQLKTLWTHSISYILNWNLIKQPPPPELGAL